MERESDRGSDRFTLDEVTQIAKEMMLSEGRHMPTIIAEGSHRTIVNMLSHLPETHEEKLKHMLAVGYGLGHRGDVGDLEQVFFISEAWMSAGDEGGLPVARPSQDPNRMEVLIIDHAELTRPKTSVAILEIVRDSQGRPIELRDVRLPSEGEGDWENPLLEAFVYGFHLSAMGRLN